jgi:hypothetical protein
VDSWIASGAVVGAHFLQLDVYVTVVEGEDLHKETDTLRSRLNSREERTLKLGFELVSGGNGQIVA